MKTKKSQQLFLRAQKKTPGGVNSPVRAFKSVGGNPLFIQKAKGATLWDVDGNAYVDYVGSWGPMILGHNHPQIVQALKKTLLNGTSFGAPSELEVLLAEEVSKAVPSMEMVRFVSSGTEAVMGAVRAARGFTGKTKVIKFDGCYHGHADYLLVKAGSGATTLGAPDSAGVPTSFAQETLIAEFNNIESVKKLVREHNDIACIILEPVVGNMGVILPQNNFLKNLENLCSQEKIILIFDEVMTGFRLAYGGAQAVYKIKPDLTTLGKIIGGGMPVGAYGGRKEIMSCVAPLGPVYQAGTLSGNPMAMEAGLATLKTLKALKPYNQLEKNVRSLTQELNNIAQKAGVAVVIQQSGSMWTCFFTESPVVDPTTARRSDTQKFGRFFRNMLNQGIYLAPSQFEACFVSIAHRQKEFEKTIKAASTAFRE